MTAKQLAELRAGTIRGRLAEIASTEDLTDELRTEMTELRTEYADVEKRVAAFAISEDQPTVTPTGEEGEATELRALRGRVEFGNYVTAAVEKRAVSGAELELNQHFNIGAHRFPLEMLAPHEAERRATTDVDTTTTPRRWVDRLFNASAAARIGLTFESVGPGVASYPIMKTGGSGVQRARSEAVSADTWTIGSSELKPTRHGIRRVFSREDDLRNPGLSDQLTRDLRMSLSDSMDLAVFEGDSGASGTDADITGLNTAASVVEKTITQANKIKPKETLEEFAALADGKHAESLGDLRIVASVGANVLWLTTIANSATENQTLAQFLMASGLSWGVRGGLETTTTNGKFGAYIGRARGIEGAGVVPVWQDGFLTVDPYTEAAKGEIVLTLSTFWNFGLVRPTNFSRIKFVS